ncbi:hypothetical protein HNV08_09310 [Winogradskyella eckloniae]|uniref:hypothetical protein n=1 Tax=Winogradskyella eckloniae TaxID=1089306 RepID=UPI0015639038|nr:hypothetical protein [Winogradskyella eckloniae]NRD20245.1 hypothetical protein [Winogradskyella eckloniae]
MKKALNIAFIILGIASLIFIGIMIFIGTAMGYNAENYDFSKPQMSKTDTITTKRMLFVFHTEIAKPIMVYELFITDNDSITKYSYRNLENEGKHMEFSYHKVSKQLTFAFDKFILSDNVNYQNKEIHKSNFGIYILKDPYDDATGPLLFNPEYGVLGIGNSYGPEFVYLPNSNLELTKDVINELYK